MYWITEWDENYLAWDCDLSRIFLTFYFRMISDFQKNYEDTKQCSHILITQTSLYNILHNCKFYAVLSKLIKLASLLFYSLQTFSEFHHFFHVCFHVPRWNLGFNHHVSLSVSIRDYFWASFTSCPNNWMVGISSMSYTEMNAVSFIYQFNEHLWR